MGERYPLKATEKKWRTCWGVDTPFSLDKNLVFSRKISHFGDIRPLIYADIALKRGKPSSNLAVLPLISPVYQDKSGCFVSFDDVIDENTVKKGKNEPMSEEKKNIISNNSVLSAYGHDACRLFLVSDNPPSLPLLYDDDAIEGAWRFINLFWQKARDILNTPPRNPRVIEIHKAEINALFDTDEIHKAVAKCREIFKTLETQEDLKELCLLLSPVIPHVTAEILYCITKQNA